MNEEFDLFINKVYQIKAHHVLFIVINESIFDSMNFIKLKYGILHQFDRFIKQIPSEDLVLTANGML